MSAVTRHALCVSGARAFSFGGIRVRMPGAGGWLVTDLRLQGGVRCGKMSYVIFMCRRDMSGVGMFYTSHVLKPVNDIQTSLLEAAHPQARRESETLRTCVSRLRSAFESVLSLAYLVGPEDCSDIFWGNGVDIGLLLVCGPCVCCQRFVGIIVIGRMSPGFDELVGLFVLEIR